MATFGDKTVILNVPMTGEAVCVVFRDTTGAVKHRIVLFPPQCETGYHEATDDYTIHALTNVNLARYDRDGKPIDPLTMNQGDTYPRNAEDAKHNVCNETDDCIVMAK